MTKEGKCIVVSDVHLGTENSNRDKFIDFITKKVEECIDVCR